MDAENFNEPWTAKKVSQDAYDLLNADGDSVLSAMLDDSGSAEPCVEDRLARRILACVNACRGISTKELEEYKDGSLRHVIDCLEGLVEPSSGHAMWDS